MLAMSPELLDRLNWASHSEGFPRRFEALKGLRFPGARRHKNRSSATPRFVNVDLI